MSLGGFMDLLKQIDPSLTDKEMEAIFRYLDLNEDGKIGFKEAEICLYRLIQVPPPQSEEMHQNFKKVQDKKVGVVGWFIKKLMMI